MEVDERMPVIVVSRFRQHGSLIDPKLWLTKPISTEKLVASISEVVESLQTDVYASEIAPPKLKKRIGQSLLVPSMFSEGRTLRDAV